MSNIYIGTSGWNYLHWRERFYPSGLSQNKWLEYYTNFFNTTELNVTFYRLIQRKVFENWYKRTPEEFYFVVKGSRFITHIKRLKNCQKPLNLFLSNAQGLKNKLGAILWQLPPRFEKNIERLETFLKLLKKTSTRQVFEFRHPSWFDEQIYALLSKYKTCLCIAHSGNYPCVKKFTTDFIYLRFHGGRLLYAGNYSDKQLKQWVRFVKKIFASGLKAKDVYAFFNNDARGYAIKNALKFKKLLEQ